jgi:hypothetical protein
VLVGTRVFVGAGVWVGKIVGAGVQVGGRTLFGVGVAVGYSALGGNVGGGKGFNAFWGLTRSTPTPTQTHKVINSTITVRIFHITPALSLLVCSDSSE